VSKQNNTLEIARIFPFEFGRRINLLNEDFWKFSLDWVLNIRLEKDQFELCDDGFYTTAIQYKEDYYEISIFEEKFKKIFPTKKTKNFKPQNCFTDCVISLKESNEEGYYMTIVGPDFPKNLVCQNLKQIKKELHENFDLAKTIATLAIEWCDIKELNNCEL
jgi:hypothetical protein